MELFDAIKGRRSVRSFKDKKVEDEKIGKILEAFRWAPSAGNRQPWNVIVVSDYEIIENITSASFDQEWIATAPVVFVVCINENIVKLRYGNRGEVYALETIGCAIQNMMLTAYSLGLGSCFVGAFDEGEVKKILNCPEHIRPIAIVPIGYSDELPELPTRDEISQFTYTNKYGENYRVEWKGLSRYKRDAKRKLLKTLRKI